MADFAPQVRLTYTKLAGLTPPTQGSVIRITTGISDDGPLFRVLNAPELDDDGAFTIEIEPVGQPGTSTTGRSDHD